MDRDEDLRAAYERSMKYATPSGRDIEAGVLPHLVECGGIKYRSVSSSTSANEPTFTAEAIEAFDSLIGDNEWSIRFIGDYEGPEIENGDRPFSLSAVWISAGQLRAVFSTVGGGPVGTGPELVREDLDAGTMRMMYLLGELLIPSLNESAMPGSEGRTNPSALMRRMAAYLDAEEQRTS